MTEIEKSIEELRDGVNRAVLKFYQDTNLLIDIESNTRFERVKVGFIKHKIAVKASTSIKIINRYEPKERRENQQPNE